MKKLLAVLFCMVVALGTVSAQQRFVTIATGGVAGTYFPLGGALAEIWNKNIPQNERQCHGYPRPPPRMWQCCKTVKSTSYSFRMTHAYDAFERP